MLMQVMQLVDGQIEVCQAQHLSEHSPRTSLLIAKGRLILVQQRRRKELTNPSLLLSETLAEGDERLL